MFNAFALFRSLVIYGVCLPLAIFLGYLLASPDDSTNAGIVLLVLSVLLLPLVLRHHHPFLVLSWNMAALAFFLPGRPLVWLPMVFLSFLISVLQYALDKKNTFLPSAPMALPLLFLGVVVLMTAELTGGIGLRVAGGGSYGGKRYITIFAAIAGYFALSAKPIPPERARFYVRLFLLAALTAVIGNLATIISPSLYFIFWLFPPDFAELTSMAISDASNDGAVVRYGGLAVAGSTLAVFTMATLGIRGLFDATKFWRLGGFLVFCGMATLGGYRSALIFIGLVFLVQFYLEGLFRTRLAPILALTAIVVLASVLPFAKHLPLSVQRTLSFLPIEIDAMTAMDAQGSVEWRLAMWERTVPEIPHYLLLGKGYSIDPGALEMVEANNMKGLDPFEGAFLAGDYHSGPLSVIMPFGIWGVLAFLWFLQAGLKTLYRNYLYSSVVLKGTNTFFLAYFIAKVVFFFGIFGSLYSDMPWFTGVLGLSIALNGGILGPAPAPVSEPVVPRFKLITITR